MDLSLKEIVDGSVGPWTEELHYSFLNWLEESFVRQVLADRRAGAGSGHGGAYLASFVGRPPPPLDRFVPDSATESTRDRGKTDRTGRSGMTPAMRKAAEDAAARGHGEGRPRRLTAEEEPGDDGESDVTSRPRTRKRPLLCSQDNSAAEDQVGSPKSDETASHLTKPTEEAGAPLLADRQESTVVE